MAPQPRRQLCSCRCVPARPTLSLLTPLLGRPAASEAPSALLAVAAAATAGPAQDRLAEPELPQMAYAQEREIIAFRNHTHERTFICATIHTIFKDRNLHLAISIQQAFSGCPPKHQFLNQVPRIERKQDVRSAVNDPAGAWRYTGDGEALPTSEGLVLPWQSQTRNT